MALKDEHDRALDQLRETRAQVEATIRQAATDATRADHLGEELKRLRNAASQQPAAPETPAASAPQTTTAKHRRRKATSEDS
jgi:hypothetical protein